MAGMGCGVRIRQKSKLPFATTQGGTAGKRRIAARLSASGQWPLWPSSGLMRVATDCWSAIADVQVPDRLGPQYLLGHQTFRGSVDRYSEINVAGILYTDFHCPNWSNVRQ